MLQITSVSSLYSDLKRPHKNFHIILASKTVNHITFHFWNILMWISFFAKLLWCLSCFFFYFESPILAQKMYLSPFGFSSLISGTYRTVPKPPFFKLILVQSYIIVVLHNSLTYFSLALTKCFPTIYTPKPKPFIQHTIHFFRSSCFRNQSKTNFIKTTNM